MMMALPWCCSNENHIHRMMRTDTYNLPIGRAEHYPKSASAMDSVKSLLWRWEVEDRARDKIIFGWCGTCEEACKEADACMVGLGFTLADDRLSAMI